MYLSTIGRTELPADSAAPGRRGRLRVVGGNVLALGTVSLITDVSAEMVTAVLPLYLVLGLQLSPLAYGALDGLNTGATALLRVVGGYVADRVSRRKAVAGAGYGLSALAKLGLVAAGGSVTALGLVLTADRAGKGLRTAPRDALITLSTPEHALGRAFGVHRAMDSLGAFAGPLAALAVLTAAAQSFEAVFVTSFCVAALGVLVLLLFVRDHRTARPPTGTVSPRAVGRLLREAPVRRLVGAACLLGLATVGDGFVYLLLQRRESLSLGWFPLLAVGTSLSYLLLAAPLGALADRIGRLPVMLGGYGVLAVVYLLLHGPLDGPALLVTVLFLYGLFYASTEGVLMALAGPVLPERLRTTGIALVQSGQALAYLGSSVLFGLAWQAWGAEAASRGAAVAVVVVGAATALLLGPLRRRAAPTPRAAEVPQPSPAPQTAPDSPAPPVSPVNPATPDPARKARLLLMKAMTNAPSQRVKILVTVLAAVLLAALAAATVVRARQNTTSDAKAGADRTPAGAAASPDAARHPGVRVRVLSNGLLSTVSLDDPSGPRTVTSTHCDRAYTAGGTTACLTPAGALSGPRLLVLDERQQTRRTVPLTGLPNRTRVSADGRMVAWTLFVGGDSYAGGGFSTRTGVLDTRTGRLVPSLEDFAVFREGRRYRAADINVWGVTFAAGGNRFYATVSSAGTRSLVEGDLAARTLRTLADNVECPSLSPDGERIAFKQAVGADPAKGWRVTVLELATLRRTELAETRNVDDQAAWLDDATVAYALQRPDGTNDVWTVAADGSGKPRLLIPGANSPAVLPAAG
ncbi:MFS transporter [Streptomyces showdoensis]|uniref:MFS transporter n=1 Tax=Streptomyces showdoensis TaxID=68268 RepID=UPI001F0B13D5|nr:MFS transporter [Streptomyces showdoensis]